SSQPGLRRSIGDRREQAPPGRRGTREQLSEVVDARGADGHGSQRREGATLAPPPLSARCLAGSLIGGRARGRRRFVRLMPGAAALGLATALAFGAGALGADRHPDAVAPVVALAGTVADAPAGLFQRLRSLRQPPLQPDAGGMNVNRFVV